MKKAETKTKTNTKTTTNEKAKNQTNTKTKPKVYTNSGIYSKTMTKALSVIDKDKLWECPRPDN